MQNIGGTDASEPQGVSTGGGRNGLISAAIQCAVEIELQFSSRRHECDMIPDTPLQSGRPVDQIHQSTIANASIEHIIGVHAHGIWGRGIAAIITLPTSKIR